MHHADVRLERTAAILMALALAASPAYVVRFHLGLPTTLLEILLVLAIVIGFAAFRMRVPWRTSYTVPAALFLLGATVDVFVSPDRRAALGIWKAYFIEPAAAALIIAELARRRANARLLLAGLGVAGTIVAVANIAVVLRALLSGHFNVVHPPVVIYNTPNAVPLYLVPLEAFALPVALYASDFTDRLAAAAFVAISTVAVVLSYSRGGWLALAACALFVALFTPLRWRIAGGLAAVFVAAVVAVPGVRRRIAIELDPTNPNNSIGLRVALWRSTLNMLRHRPVFGGGLSGFERSVQPYRDPSYHEQLIYPHNLVLNFWSETGLIGVAGFIWMAIAAVRNALAGLRLSPWTRALSIGLLTLLVAFAVHGVADVPYFKNYQALAFWALVAVQLGALLGESAFSGPQPGREPAMSPAPSTPS